MGDTADGKTLPTEVDVIVVGSGAAALTGAYTAATRGMQVLVLEKAPVIGGISAYSGAGIWLPGNAALRRAGVDDTVDAGVAYVRATVGDRTPRDLQETYVRTGPDLVEFLEADEAIEFAHHRFPDYFDAPGRALPDGRTIRPLPLAGNVLGERLTLIRPMIGADMFGLPESRDLLDGGQALIGRLLLALDGTGNADLRTQCPMHSLVLTDGRVTGVVAGEGRESVTARSGVLLAAGGFECDESRRREHHGLPGAAWTSSPVGSNTGDAMEAARSVGAAVDLLDEAWWCPSVLFPSGHSVFASIISGGIFVDPDGQRFANESLPYDQMGHALKQQYAKFGPEAEFWWIFDSRTESIPGFCGFSGPLPDATEFRAAGLWRSGRTPEELAERIGVPARNLRATVDRFNEFSKVGFDSDFHRGEDDYDRFFGVGDGPNGVLVPLTEGDLHAVRIVLGDLGSKGGAVIDRDGRVLGDDGAPIPGLFAAGGSTASVAGHVYPGPGVPLGLGMVFGYRAASEMSASRQ
ncbi:FAD-dependent oxidoreductase [Gordonia sp. NPDC127522]|uniref:FAD-dependent oxidoreductase n=1 Tax=Gordonia sp. NPDC127522 TaxID=3345390 RepID=UPI003636EE0E